MSKVNIIQISVVLVASLVTLGLYFLPRVVVDNEKTDAMATMPKTTGAIQQSSHDMSTNVESDSLNDWKKTLLNDNRSISNLDTIAHYYLSVNMFDSAAHYKELIYKQEENASTLFGVADVYYQAFRFSMNADRAKILAKKSRKYLDLLQKTDPDNLDTKVKIGMTHMTSSNPMKGISMLLDVVKTNPDHELALFNLGLLSVQRGAPDKAVARFKDVIRVNPANKDAYILLAQNYEALEDIDNAINILQRLLKLEIKEEEKKKVLDYIKALKKK